MLSDLRITYYRNFSNIKKSKNTLYIYIDDSYNNRSLSPYYYNYEYNYYKLPGGADPSGPSVEFAAGGAQL